MSFTRTMASQSFDGRPCIIAFEEVPSSSLPEKGPAKLSHLRFRKARKPTHQVFAQKMNTTPREVVMVDPIEAKRLAAEQLKRLEAKAKFKRQQEIEAINGGLAMLGITVCLIIEGYTGKTILSQIAGYLHVLADIFDNFLPPSQP